MITIKNGRARSERTSEEVEEMLAQELGQLTPAERATFDLILEEMKGKRQVGGKSLLDVIGGAEYKTPPVDIRTFVQDPFYLGHTCDSIYPKLLDDLVELFEGGGYVEVILTGSIGWGKCVVKSRTYVTEAETGRRCKIEELEGKTPLVPSFVDQERIGVALAEKVWSSGQKECARLEVASGQWLEASWDHPVFTPFGYKPLSELREGDFVACARYAPAPKKPHQIGDAEVQTLACLIADGGLTHGSHKYFKDDARLVDSFSEAVQKVPGCTGLGVRKFEGGCWQQSFLGLNEWTDRWGIRCLSKDKRVPPELFGLSDPQLALFLRWLFTDGNVYTGKPRKIELTLASEGLIEDVQELLRRFGIVARKYYSPKTIKSLDKEYDAWKLEIADAPTILLFLAAIGEIPGKEDACKEIKRQAEAIKPNTNWDVVPIGTSEVKEIRREVGSVPNKEWLKFASLAAGSCMGASKFRRLCDRFDYRGKYAWLASDAIVWERATSLERIGLREVYDLAVPATGNVVANGFVIHNTFLASIGLCRILYEISCLKDPHSSFGLARDSNIAIVCFSINESLAAKVVYENIVTKIKASPYFQQHFPFEPTKKELRFPGNVWVAPRASTDTSALGLNTISAIIDETNFLVKRKTILGEESRADTIYHAIKRRMKSRFEKQGKLPGMLFLVSSKKTDDDFTAQRIKESMNEATAFVRDYSIWDVKPAEDFKSKCFWVLCGNSETASRLLTDEEYAKYKDEVPEGSVLISVPEDFRHDFEADLDGAIKDIAGIAVVAVRPFIQRREKLREAIDPQLFHPFSTVIYDMSKGGRFIWERMVALRTERGPGRLDYQRQRPIVDPIAARHIHIDIGLRKDRLGFVMAHVSGWKEVIRKGEDSREFSERAPVYTVDLALQVIPAIGGEVLLSEVRHLVYDLTDHGYMITTVTADQYQSAEMLQVFTSKGYRAQLISVDATPAPYDNLKSAIYEGRLRMYEYPVLMRELVHLQEDLTGNRRKIDHPSGESKDVSDALAGALYTLSQLRLQQPLPILKSVQYAQDSWMEEQRHAMLAGNPGAGTNSNLLPAFLSGTGDDDGWESPWRPR